MFAVDSRNTELLLIFLPSVRHGKLLTQMHHNDPEIDSIFHLISI